MKVAILGATGAVGEMILEILEESELPITEIVPLASARSEGKVIRWRDREWKIQVPAAGVFEGCQIALLSAGATRSREWAPVAAAEGAVVIDNSSGWRMDPKVPLVVPEVNGASAAERPLGIIANPNCVAIQTVMALEALRRSFGLRRVIASTYQSVSGAGQQGVSTLEAELEGQSVEGSPFVAPIAGNVIPQIGTFNDDGWTGEEDKFRDENRKILGLPGLPIVATCVRVPVVFGHSVSLMVETERTPSLEEASAAFGEIAGIELTDATDLPPTPIDLAGTDLVRVGRLRLDPDLPNVIHAWVVADNLRRGAATNAVRIAELISRG